MARKGAHLIELGYQKTENEDISSSPVKYLSRLSD
jgi:hypothetical protein